MILKTRPSQKMSMAFRLPPARVETLLAELCVVLGFCLPPEAVARLKSNPPTDVEQFTDAVIRSEGLDPYADIPLHLRRVVRDKVRSHFEAAEAEFLGI